MKKYSIEIKWAVRIGLIYLAWLYFEKILGFHNAKAIYQPLFNLLFIPILLTLYFLALKDKKKVDFNNEINWKQGFGSGIILAFFITLTTSIATYVMFIFLSPDFFTNAMEQINKESIADKYNINIFIKNNIYDKLSFGVVFAALTSYFIKNKVS